MIYAEYFRLHKKMIDDIPGIVVSMSSKPIGFKKGHIYNKKETVVCGEDYDFPNKGLSTVIVRYNVYKAPRIFKYIKGNTLYKSL